MAAGELRAPGSGASRATQHLVLALLSSVDGDTTGRHPVDRQSGLCAEAHLGCPCRGDRSIHEERSREIADARAQAGEPVECPECGVPTTALAIVTWGNCRASRTAHTRATHPLRW